jgi:phage internal scaffolding protein
MSRKIKKAYKRTRVTTDVLDRKTKCLQSEKKSSDINHIVSKAVQTGMLPIRMNRQPLPALPDAMTYQDMLNKVVFAQQQFDRLPSNIRAEFSNDPANMLRAVHDSSDNLELKEKLQKLGILELTQSPPEAPSEEPLPPPPSSDED